MSFLASSGMPNRSQPAASAPPPPTLAAVPSFGFSPASSIFVTPPNINFGGGVAGISQAYNSAYNAAAETNRRLYDQIMYGFNAARGSLASGYGGLNDLYGGLYDRTANAFGSMLDPYSISPFTSSSQLSNVYPYLPVSSGAGNANISSWRRLDGSNAMGISPQAGSQPTFSLGAGSRQGGTFGSVTLPINAPPGTWDPRWYYTNNQGERLATHQEVMNFVNSTGRGLLSEMNFEGRPVYVDMNGAAYVATHRGGNVHLTKVSDNIYSIPQVQSTTGSGRIWDRGSNQYMNMLRGTLGIFSRLTGDNPAASVHGAVSLSNLPTVGGVNINRTHNNEYAIGGGGSNLEQRHRQNALPGVGTVNTPAGNVYTYQGSDGSLQGLTGEVRGGVRGFTDTGEEADPEATGGVAAEHFADVQRERDIAAGRIVEPQQSQPQPASSERRRMSIRQKTLDDLVRRGTGMRPNEWYDSLMDEIEGLPPGYQALMRSIYSKLGYLGMEAEQRIADQYARRLGEETAALQQSGLGNASILASARRGAAHDASKQLVQNREAVGNALATFGTNIGLTGLGEAGNMMRFARDLAFRERSLDSAEKQFLMNQDFQDRLARAGISKEIGLAGLSAAERGIQGTSNIDLARLNFLNSIQAPYPDAGLFGGLAQQAANAELQRQQMMMSYHLAVQQMEENKRMQQRALAASNRQLNPGAPGYVMQSNRPIGGPGPSWGQSTNVMMNQNLQDAYNSGQNIIAGPTQYTSEARNAMRNPNYLTPEQYRQYIQQQQSQQGGAQGGAQGTAVGAVAGAIAAYLSSGESD